MIDETLFEAEEKMEKAVSVAREDFATIRTGRANPAMFSKIMVDYYGAPTPVNQLASFHVVDARMLTLTPFDKGAMEAIERSIRDSDLGVNPTNDGALIRIAFPQLTEERRKELVKVVHARREEAHVAVRNIRRDAIKDLRDLEEEKEISEDDLKRGEEEVQKLTDEIIREIDQLGANKEREVMEV